ncbi:MAG: response regulator [Methanomicrobium sp.]|nr:response regulator [Methanomicrobium sp.]
MATNKKILIVEDEGIVSLEIRETLENLGYIIVGEAQSGIEAIEMANEFHPDLVLMDIVLQGDMDGIEAAERIYTLYDIPVIYLTSHSDEATLKRALKTNAFGYLIKPFNDRELYSNIEMTLHKHRIMKNVEPTEVIDSTLTLVSDAVITTDRRGNITRINPPAESLTGWSRGDALGFDIFTIFELDREKISGFMESVRLDAFEKRTLLSWVDGLKLKTKAGGNISLSLNIGFVKGNKLNPDEYFFVLIPDDKDGGRQSRLEMYYRIVLDAIKDPVFLSDSDMKIILYNQAFSDLCGVLGVNLNHLSKPAYEVLPTDIFGSKWDYEEIFKTKTAYNKERTYKKDKETRFINLETIPLSDGNSITHMAVIIFDVTWQKEMDERDEMIARNFKAHSKNVEEIADLCALLKPPLGKIRKIAESTTSSDNKNILRETKEMYEILFNMDMKWLKYEKIKNYFDVRGGSLPDEAEEEEN